MTAIVRYSPDIERAVRLKWTMTPEGQWVQQLFERDSRGDRNILAALLPDPITITEKDTTHVAASAR